MPRKDLDVFDFEGKPTILLRPGANEATVSNMVLSQFRMPDGCSGVLVPVYTSIERAKAALADAETASVARQVELRGVNGLESLLKELKEHGVTHVAFNFKATTPVPIEDVIESLGNR